VTTLGAPVREPEHVGARPRRTSRLRYNPALDGLRALAVTAVLAFHGGMPWARGGFLGVDAFFVLSGYLITGLLLAEWEQTGRIDLRAFWVRRARRLLPALFVLVIVVTVFARTLMPREDTALLRGDGLAALFYVANWRMILRGGDYFAQTASPSPLQHTWSLGIEEQFYVAWPLLLVVLLVGLARWHAGRRRALRRVAIACAAGVAASALLLAVLYRAEDPGRSYYGTDTRGASLLTGAGLAVVLAAHRSGDGHRDRTLKVSRLVRAVLGALAGAAVLTLAWAWTQMEGGDPWLYLGGLLVVALAVAVVLLHVVLVPGGWPERLLALAPLVLLGRISYGVYLWHWPVFLTVNAERTGHQGAVLFVVRCLVTVGIAALSYELIERPVRRGWLFGGRWSATAATAIVGAGSVAVVLMLTAVPTSRVADAGALGVGGLAEVDGHGGPTSPTPDSPEGSHTATPAQSRHRHPLAGRTPVIDVFGDSVAWTLVQYLPEQRGLDIRDRTALGCGVVRLAPYRYFGQTYAHVADECRAWPGRWEKAIAADDPDVVVIMVGRWETMDRQLEGRWTHVGEPAFDAYLRDELELAIETTGAHGAKVVLATEPYNRRGEQFDGSLFPEDEPSRVTGWNSLLREVASDHARVAVLDIGARISPGDSFTWSAGGVQIRSDGLHLTPSGVERWIAPWLVPQLRAAVTHS
jgi:peptidoglycan/LPS O-acetylase OafA/YrhL